MKISPNEQTAWREVGKLGLEKYLDNPLGSEPKLRDIAEHWRLWELRKEGIIGKKADETADRDEHNLDTYVLLRWSDRLAKSIRPDEVETWFEVLAVTTPQGKRNKPLMWPTIDKVNSVMSQIYSHVSQRRGLISAEMVYNPFRSPKFGGVRCKTQTDYEAKGCYP